MDTTVPQLDVSQQEAAIKTRRRAPTFLLTGMSAATIWVLLSAIGAIALTVLESNAGDELTRVNIEKEAVQKQRAPYLIGQQILDTVQANKARAEIAAGSVLGRVAASTTPGVTLTGIHISSDGKVALEGTALNSAAMQQFARALAQGRAVQAPGFEMMRQDQRAGLQFRIVGTFPRGGAAQEQKQAGQP